MTKVPERPDSVPANYEWNAFFGWTPPSNEAALRPEGPRGDLYADGAFYTRALVATGSGHGEDAICVARVLSIRAHLDEIGAKIEAIKARGGEAIKKQCDDTFTGRHALAQKELHACLESWQPSAQQLQQPN